MDLLNLCLTSTYFQYNGKHYKQLHGTAMGSPVSVVVAEIVMQNIEERALVTCRQIIPLWLRYVDDAFTAVFYPLALLTDSASYIEEELKLLQAELSSLKSVPK